MNGSPTEYQSHISPFSDNQQTRRGGVWQSNLQMLRLNNKDPADSHKSQGIGLGFYVQPVDQQFFQSFRADDNEAWWWWAPMQWKMCFEVRSDSYSRDSQFQCDVMSPKSGSINHSRLVIGSVFILSPAKSSMISSIKVTYSLENQLMERNRKSNLLSSVRWLVLRPCEWKRSVYL